MAFELSCWMSKRHQCRTMCVCVFRQYEIRFAVEHTMTHSLNVCICEYCVSIWMPTFLLCAVTNADGYLSNDRPNKPHILTFDDISSSTCIHLNSINVYTQPLKYVYDCYCRYRCHCPCIQSAVNERIKIDSKQMKMLADRSQVGCLLLI